jgi:hypothetical protein
MIEFSKSKTSWSDAVGILYSLTASLWCVCVFVLNFSSNLFGDGAITEIVN